MNWRFAHIGCRGRDESPLLNGVCLGYGDSGLETYFFLYCFSKSLLFCGEEPFSADGFSVAFFVHIVDNETA
jgi:hypothetical protein